MDVDRIIDIAENIVITQYQSVPFLSNFGCTIQSRVDSLLSLHDIEDMKIEIQGQFNFWLPGYLQSISITNNIDVLNVNIGLKNIGIVNINF